MLGPYEENTIVQGHVLDVLAELPDESIHMVCTSPPYWGLRDYGTEPQVWGGDDECQHAWGEEIITDARGTQIGKAVTVDARESTRGQFCSLCGCWRGCLGLESSPDLYVQHIVEIFREVRRVLRSDGTLWLNLGASYANDGKWGGATGGKHARGLHGATGIGRRKVHSGFKPKDLVPIPWMVAMSLQADGWWLRSSIIWAKGISFCPTYSGSCMPESVKDRPTQSYEYVFLLTKSARYYYAADAVREPQKAESLKRYEYGSHHRTDGTGLNKGGGQGFQTNRMGDHINPAGRNLRSVWAINPHPFPQAHFATFPPKLVEPCVLAGTSAKGVCPECGSPWKRVVEKSTEYAALCESEKGQWHPKPEDEAVRGQRDGPKTHHGNISAEYCTIGWQPTCACYDSRYRADFAKAKSPRKRWQRDISGDWWRRVRRRPGLSHWPTKPAIVLDPFIGSGTVAKVALEHRRHYFGIDLQPDYVEMAERRIGTVQPAMQLW